MVFEKGKNFYKYKEIVSHLVVGNIENVSDPIVSIVMPIFNHPDFFKDALDSAINQDYNDAFEIIVVDNNHPIYQKQNQAIVENANSKLVNYYVNEKNIGGAGNTNRGIELARGKYITFCHDDDILTSDALSVLLETKTKYPEDCLIIGHHVIIDKESVIIGRQKLEESKRCISLKLSKYILGNNTNGVGALYLKDTLIELGGFQEEYIPCPDYYLNASYTYYYRTIYLYKTTFYYRITEQSDSKRCYMDIPQAHDKIFSHIYASGKVNKRMSKIIYNVNKKNMFYRRKYMWEGNISLKDYLIFTMYRILNRISSQLISIL